jgi:hypothetical protein
MGGFGERPIEFSERPREFGERPNHITPDLTKERSIDGEPGEDRDDYFERLYAAHEAADGQTIVGFHNNCKITIEEAPWVRERKIQAQQNSVIAARNRELSAVEEETPGEQLSGEPKEMLNSYLEQVAMFPAGDSRKIFLEGMFDAFDPRSEPEKYIGWEGYTNEDYVKFADILRAELKKRKVL